MNTWIQVFVEEPDGSCTEYGAFDIDCPELFGVIATQWEWNPDGSPVAWTDTNG